MLRRIHLEGSCEPRDGYWVAKVANLGVFGYGGSPEEARKRADFACDLLFEHWEKHGVIEERLREAGVEFENAERIHWSAERVLKTGTHFSRTEIDRGA